MLEKNDIIEIICNYNLMDTQADACRVSYAMDIDDFADYCGFLLLGDWSRNITVLDADMRRDPNIRELFDHIERYCS